MEKRPRTTRDYFIIKDTREKRGWFFSPFDTCAGTIEQKLDTGDYAIKGLEDKLCVERKACPEELSLNLGKQKDTFMREIDRMKEFEHKFIILEFSVEDLLGFPENAKMTNENKGATRVSGKYLLKCLMEFQINDGIHVVFCGNKKNSFLFVSSLFKRIYEKYGKKDDNQRDTD